MLNASSFYIIYICLYYMLVKTITKNKRDRIICHIMMICNLALFTLYFFGVPFPYLVDVLSFVTKPLSEPLKHWLNSFPKP